MVHIYEISLNLMALKYVIGDDEILSIQRCKTAVTSRGNLIEGGRRRRWF